MNTAPPSPRFSLPTLLYWALFLAGAATIAYVLTPSLSERSARCPPANQSDKDPVHTGSRPIAKCGSFFERLTFQAHTKSQIESAP